MGYISMNEGKWIFPVPWKTGYHYSQKRLSEFQEIKQVMKLPSNKQDKSKIIPPSENALSRKSEKTVESISGSVPKPFDHPQILNETILSEFENVQFTPVRKYRKPQKKLAQWKLVIDDGDELESFDTKKLPKHSKYIITKVPKDIVWSVSGERKSGMSEAALNISKELNLTEMSSELPHQEVEQVKKEEPKKEKYENNIVLKVKDFAQSDGPKKFSTYGLIFISSVGLIGLIMAGLFLFTVFFMPEWLVGGVEWVPKNSTNPTLQLQNLTNTLIPIQNNNQTGINNPLTINPLHPIVINSNPNIVEVNIPPETYRPPVNNPPIVIVNSTTSPPPPNNNNPSSQYQVRDEKGVSHDYSSVPSNLQFQTKYSCYWELRTKGFGSLFSAEAECNMQTTGLWLQACQCCHQINPKACD